MMRCPSCKATDKQPAWLAHLPSKVAADLGAFINCDRIFSVPGVFCCINCGSYFQANAGADAAPVQDAWLRNSLRTSLCPNFAEVLSYPPDLLRVLINELELGNEAVEFLTSPDQVQVVSLRYRFLDGHIVSSWVEYKSLPEAGRWPAWYFCPAVQKAVACERPLLEPAT